MGKIPCQLWQTTCDDTRVELASLETEKLEQTLKAQRILPEKIIVRVNNEKSKVQSLISQSNVIKQVVFAMPSCKIWHNHVVENQEKVT